MSNTEYWTEANPHVGSRRQQRQNSSLRRRQRRNRTFIILGLCAALFAGAGFAAYKFLLPGVTKVFGAAPDYEGPGSAEMAQITIEKGEFGAKIGEKLVAADVVKSAEAFKAAVSAHEKGSSIQPGTYQLPKQIPARNAVTLLLDPTSKQQIVVQVTEGRRAKEIYGMIAKELNVPVADVEAAAKKDIGLPAAAKNNPEGYLFPATYDFGLNTTAQQMLAAMVSRWKTEMKTLGISDADHREIMVKASIVEAEGGKADIAPKIARVIENRLAIDMKLQMDSSVSYLHNERRIDTSKDQRATDSPYNTYMYTGLPAGPISNPGTTAYKAVLNPTPGKWLYFVAVDTVTGETKFAVTEAEHFRNVAEWKRRAAERKRNG